MVKQLRATKDQLEAAIERATQNIKNYIWKDIRRERVMSKENPNLVEQCAPHLRGFLKAVKSVDEHFEIRKKMNDAEAALAAANERVAELEGIIRRDVWHTLPTDDSDGIKWRAYAADVDQQRISEADRAEQAERERHEARADNSGWMQILENVAKDIERGVDPSKIPGYIRKHLSYPHPGAALLADNRRMREALIRLRDCDWVITPHDRMDAVRDIARAALEAKQ